MKPFLKWAGGKTQLLPHLLMHAPKTFGDYYEPFVGGGALFFAIEPERAFLGDTNEALFAAYATVKHGVESLIDELATYKHSEDEYYRIRAEPMTPANFIYLNKTCYNGLYRVNQKGKFNVPFGRYKRPTICDEPTLRACSVHLRRSCFNCSDFEVTVSSAVKGDFVYFDPPYIPVTATFQYTASSFSLDDHRRLAACALELKRRGVHVLLTNSASSYTRKIYDGFEIIEVNARRAINSNPSLRGSVKELIIK